MKLNSNKLLAVFQFRKMVYVSTILFLFFTSQNLNAQVIFSEPFDEPATSVIGNDNTGGVAWTSVCPACLAGDHYEVQGGVLEGQDTNGPATWETGLIDISSCTNFEVSFSITSVDVMEACGTGCNSVDWVQLEYNIDGTGWQTPSNSTFCAGPCADLNVIQSDDVVGGTINYSTGCVVGGSTLQLRIVVQTWAGAEMWRIDDVTVSCGGDPVVNAGADISICPGSSITLDGSGTGTPSWNNGSTLSATNILNPVASPLITTTYTLTVGSGGCVETDDVIVTILNLVPIAVSADETICPGNCANLTVSGGDFFVWDPSVDITDSSLANQNVCPAATTTYTVTSYTVGSNLISNGDFENGNTDFSSSYTFVTPINTGEAQYNVIPDPENYNGGFSACNDHTTGAGNMMVVNGSSISGSTVWCQTISVTPNTDYLFSAWLQSVFPTNPALLQFTINGISIGANLNASGTTCIWDEFFSVWNSGISTSATICITNLNTNVAGNDFALDDISFSPVCEQIESITITVGNPSVNAGVDQDVCEGDAVTLTATNPDGAIITWNNGVTDGVAFTPLVGSINYTVTATDLAGCSSTDVVNVTVVDVPNVSLNPAGPFSVSDGIQNLVSSPAGGVWSADCGACINSSTGAFNPASAGVGTWTICYTAGTIPCEVQECISIIVFDGACLLTASAIFNNPTCFGFVDGSITVNVLDEVGTPIFIITDALGNLVNSGGSNAANNLSEGWYYYNVTDGAGCIVIDSVLLEDPGQMTIDLELLQPSCFGLDNGFAYCDTVLNYTGAYNQISYFWNPNTTGINGLGEDSLQNVGEGNYNLVINDENGCSESFDFILTYPDSLYLIQFGYEPAYCRVFSYQSGNGVVFSAASGGTPDYTYLWTNLQTGVTSNNTTWGGLNPGNYQIAVTDDNGCVLTDIITVDSLNPIADFTLTSPEFTANYEGNAIVNVHFENQSSNYANQNAPGGTDTTFFWNFGMPGEPLILSHNINETFDQTYTTGGTYDACLVVYNNNGCTDTMCVPIIIYDALLFEPVNIFTPDGDGINDEFTFDFRAQSIEFFSCTIIDRWGVVMYEMTSVADAWDGADKKGHLCSDGVYFYSYQYTSFNGIEGSGQGTVHLVHGE